MGLKRKRKTIKRFGYLRQLRGSSWTYTCHPSMDRCYYATRRDKNGKLKVVDWSTIGGEQNLDEWLSYQASWGLRGHIPGEISPGEFCTMIIKKYVKRYHRCTDKKLMSIVRMARNQRADMRVMKVGKLGRGYYADVNSMYTWIASKSEMPIPMSLSAGARLDRAGYSLVKIKTSGKLPIRRAYTRNLLGVEEMHFFNSPIFATGKVKCWAFNDELVHYIESGDCEVLKIYGGVHFKKYDRTLNVIACTLLEKREIFPNVGKLVNLSFMGKFGVGHSEFIVESKVYRDGMRFGHKYFFNGEMHSPVVVPSSSPFYANMIWWDYLVALGRIHIGRYVNESTAMVLTDGIINTGNPVSEDIGDKPGQMKITLGDVHVKGMNVYKVGCKATDHFDKMPEADLSLRLAQSEDDRSLKHWIAIKRLEEIQRKAAVGEPWARIE